MDDVRRVVLGLCCLLVGACGPDTDPGGVPKLETPKCDDTGACAAGYRIRGRFYALNCDAVRPEAVTEEVVARGSGTEARRVEGVDPASLVAIRRTAACSRAEGAAASPWVMAHTSRDAVCTVVVEEQRARHQCP